MTRARLIIGSLVHHARSHVGTLLGAIVASTVLTGSLIVGDSVKKTLSDQAKLRLGRVQAAVQQHDRFFRADLASAIGMQKDAHFAPLLRLNAAGYVQDDGETTHRANQIQLIGIDDSFWQFTTSQKTKTPDDDEALINHRLAAQLGLQPGDEFRLRIAKPSVLPRDAPLSVSEDLTQTLTLTVAAVTDAAADLADFSLRPSAVPPLNVFVPLKWLQKQAELDNRANLLLAAHQTSTDIPTFVDTANHAIRQNWRLADAELQLEANATAGIIDLKTPRIFLDGPALEAGGVDDSAAVLTYIANEIRTDTNSTPYSMVTGVPADFFPNAPKGNEMLITKWLAKYLEAKQGDSVSISYFVLGLNRQLEEHNATFTVSGVLPDTERPGWRALMPQFPGIVDADDIRNWKPGFDFDADRFDTHDEIFWKQRRGTPKAFIALETGQRLWANRYGEATAVRFAFAEGKRDAIEAAIRKQFDPAKVGLVFRDVRTESVSGKSANDFGGLFIGLSFFLVLAALILVGLLFVFGVEQRAPQIGTLLAIGFTGKTVRNLLLAEGFVLALAGAVLGAIAGLEYTKGLVHLLNSDAAWAGAIGGAEISYHAEPLTVFYGVLGGLFVALFTIWLTVRKLSQASAIALIQGQLAIPTETKRGNKALITVVVCVLGALALGWAMRDAEGQAKAGGFFGAGVLLLTACLCAAHAWLTRLAQGGREGFASLGTMGMRGSARRRGRSLACVGLLAVGVFLLISISAFRLSDEGNLADPKSGTGGFGFFGQTDVPVLYDLNTRKGREELLPANVDGKVVPFGSIVQLRVREGDDSSCLNLNQTREPRILGVNPALLTKRGTFTFAKGAGWEVLGQSTDDGAVPAVVDMNTGMWALHVGVGDTLDYPNEAGGTFKIRIAGFLANSMLQGDLIIAEEQFVKQFPSASGYRAFLIDPDKSGQAIAALNYGLADDYGLELQPADKRLADFNRVQNTYLEIFQALGALALLLGSVGLGVVVLRNVMERRSELALLQAIGFAKRSLLWLVIAEHGGLLLLGVLAGYGCAQLAILPGGISHGQTLGGSMLALILGGILASGLIWTLLAAAAALRGKLLPALRRE